VTLRGRVPQKQGLKRRNGRIPCQLPGLRGRVPQKQGLKPAQGEGNVRERVLFEGEFHKNKD